MQRYILCMVACVPRAYHALDMLLHYAGLITTEKPWQSDGSAAKNLHSTADASLYTDQQYLLQWLIQCDICGWHYTHAGDDIEMSPPGWPDRIIKQFQQNPDLMLLLLRDAADPGFPSFPVLRVDQHLRIFDKLMPDCFVNQGTQDTCSMCTCQILSALTAEQKRFCPIISIYLM